jgi:hypothetical protein
MSGIQTPLTVVNENRRRPMLAIWTNGSENWQNRDLLRRAFSDRRRDIGKILLRLIARCNFQKWPSAAVAPALPKWRTASRPSFLQARSALSLLRSTADALVALS